MNISVMKHYSSALATINARTDIEPVNASDKAQFNHRVAAMYDALTTDADAIGSWNWGLWEAGLEKQIRAHLGDYEAFNTDGYSEQLYLYIAMRLGLATKRDARILEVGCGMGHGLNFLSRFHPDCYFIGLDLTQSAVDRAAANFWRKGRLEFVQGDAEDLPFDDASFDCVINVESSHNYPNLARFYSEVARVLKPGGELSQVDFFTKQRRALAERARGEAAGLVWSADDDISEQVKAAVRKRMEPNSLFRRLRRRNRGFLRGSLVERMAMVGYGADFVAFDHGFVFKTLLTKAGNTAYPIESYFHLHATKQQR